ncbi:hypothetical protein DRO64_05980 [Candidatus Bathyarchaeota archaeon]|nr:MAG: hypothetical protein DRO64_05980 [Candidatus Bathyarchaeota archaeon]
MEGSEEQKLSKGDVINSLIGGIICFFTMMVLPGIMDMLFRQILIFLGIIGVMAFDSFKIAHSIIFFGTAYLICGFLGGLYTGYKVEARLNLFLFITAFTGFISLVILLYYLGHLTIPNIYIDVIIPALAGSFIGVYLGGYTIIWPYRHEEETSTLNINLDLGGRKAAK